MQFSATDLLWFLHLEHPKISISAQYSTSQLYAVLLEGMLQVPPAMPHILRPLLLLEPGSILTPWLTIFISCLQSQYYVLTHSHSVSSSKWSLPFHLLPPMKTISWVAAFLERESPWTEVKDLWAIRKVMVSTCTSCVSFIILISQETLELLLELHLQYSRAFHYRVSNISRFFPQWVQRHRECIWVLPWQRPHPQCHFFKLVFLLMW